MATSKSGQIIGIPGVNQTLAVSRRSVRFGLDVGEAVALSFIGHQVEIAKLKRQLTRTLVSAARSTLR
jgi:uncharacterized linocin/CFP29 family protein